LKPNPILFLNTWYPNREDPWLGLFIRKQAKALAVHHPVICLYLKSASVPKMELDWEESPNYLSLNAYYPRLAPALPVLGNLIRALAYLYFSYTAWKILKKRACVGKPNRIVLNVTGPLAWLAAFLSFRLNVPLYWMEHWNAFLPGDARYSGLNIRLQSRIIHWFCRGTAAVSSALAAGMQAHHLGKNIQIIPNVVEPEFIEAGQNPTIPEKPYLLAHISNFAPFKQADKILEAIAQISQTRNDFLFEFTGLENQAKTDLLNRAKELKLFPDVVKFNPVLPENQVADYLKTISGLVTYSTQESQGVVLLEAWACGIPVICNPNMGAWELGPKEGKIEAKPDDLDSLINAIHFLLNNVQSFDRKSIAKGMASQVSTQAVGMKMIEWLNLQDQFTLNPSLP